jgi:hypothetical protein
MATPFSTGDGQMSEQERVHNIMQEKAQGNEAGRRLVWDPASKSLREADPSEPDRST